jgi:hypothetical protein
MNRVPGQTAGGIFPLWSCRRRQTALRVGDRSVGASALAPSGRRRKGGASIVERLDFARVRRVAVECR